MESPWLQPGEDVNLVNESEGLLTLKLITDLIPVPALPVRL